MSQLKRQNDELGYVFLPTSISIAILGGKAPEVQERERETERLRDCTACIRLPFVWLSRKGKEKLVFP